MVKYVLTNKAVADLTSIWDYTFQVWSESQSDKYYQLLIDGLAENARHPEKGRNYDDIQKDLQGSRVAKHIVFYLNTKTRIEILRILHDQMDLKQNLRD